MSDDLRPEMQETPGVGEAPGVSVAHASGAITDPEILSACGSNDNSREAIVASYIAGGARLVRLKPDSKKPLSEKGWQHADPKVADFLPGENVGVMLGPKSGNLIDVDLDIPQARALAGMSCFFGHLPSFGRASLPASEPGHRLVNCEDAPLKATHEFAFKGKKEEEAVASLQLPKSVVLELRGGGGYTAFPPSVLDGDALVWRTSTNRVPTMAWTELRRRAGLLAFCAFAAACYPMERGNRDTFCLHLAGALLHAGADADTADPIISEIARMRGDPERREAKARRSQERKDAGENITGLPAFLAFVGMEACDKRVRDWLGMDQGGGEPPPPDAIEVGRPDIHVFRDELEAAVARKMPERVFRRSGELVRLRKLEELDKSEDGVVRHAGVVEIAQVDVSWLRVEASRAGVQFYKRDMKGNPRLVEPPVTFSILLRVADTTSFPYLRGITSTPTLSRSAPGYDPGSGLFLAFGEDTFPSAPENPTREDALAALGRLKHPMREFPFVDAASRSVALSAILSGVVRGEMRTCPLHGFTSPEKGTGKTMLVLMAAIVGTGVHPSLAIFHPDPDEMEKRLVSLLLRGAENICIDNVEAPLTGAFLCAMLTNEKTQGRVLGRSEMPSLDTRTLVLANGKNLRVLDDMARRVVLCRLDAGVEQPEMREFDFDPVKEVEANRPQLVVDALTVLRAWSAAGRPLPQGYRTLGSFEDWDMVRGALLWLGEADPLETQAAAREGDEVRETRTLVLLALHRATKGEWFAVRELESATDGTVRGEARAEIAAWLRGGEWDRKQAGRLLAGMLDRHTCGMVLRRRLDRKGVAEWRVEGEPETAQEPREPGDDIPF